MDTVVHIDSALIARQLRIRAEQVQRTLELLDDGNTVAFITRYRKDQTGGLDEEQIRQIARLAARQRALAERKLTILKSIQSQGKLTPELQAAIHAADSLKQLEDLYLPYKPRKQTLATIARQRGLEPLMEQVLSAAPDSPDIEQLAAPYVAPEKGLTSVPEVLQGLRHLLAERFSESPHLRQALRRVLWREGKLVSSRLEPPKAVQPSAGTDGVGAVPERAADGQSGSASLGSQNDSNVDQPVSTDVAEVRSSGNGSQETSVSDASQQQLDALVAATTRQTLWGVEQPDEAKAARRQQREQRKEAKRRKLQAAFKDYFQFSEALRRIPPHRVLAINRGERAKILRVKVDVDFARVIEVAEKLALPGEHRFRDLLIAALRDALQRLVLPGLEREIRRELTERAEQHGVEVFVRNLRKLLLQPPVRGRRVVAIDPGFRSGCKVVALDECGHVLGRDVIHLIKGPERLRESQRRLSQLVRTHGISVIAIGNGAASRLTEHFVAQTIEEDLRDLDVAYVVVNEAGASVYSTSPLGREELPEFDPQLRSAISIGRRLLDPLSELVKIHPANLGVGLYQHDVKARHLQESLDEVVASCVNYVGVDVNTASVALLRYVSGLNQLTARRIVEYRKEHGPFRSREDLKKVPGLGEATFVQAAGFLRVHDGDNPLDSTWIHPESYHVAERILERLGASVEWLRSVPSSPDTTASPLAGAAQPGAGVANVATVEGESPAAVVSGPTAHAMPSTRSLRAELARRISQVEPSQLAAELGAGEHLVRDILAALSSPPRDPREDFPPPVLRRGIMKLDDLKPGMELTGTVLNVVDFGAFIDIGLLDCGLVHISRLADRFIRDPHEVVGVGDTLRVWVLDVDRARRRVSLSAIPPEKLQSKNEAARARPGSEPVPSKAKTKPPTGPSPAKSAPQSVQPQPAAVAKANVTTESCSAATTNPAPAPVLAESVETSVTRDRVAQERERPVGRSPRPVERSFVRQVSLSEAKQEGREPLRSFAELLEYFKQRHTRP